jgi:hypothetical protein
MFPEDLDESEEGDGRGWGVGWHVFYGVEKPVDEAPLLGPQPQRVQVPFLHIQQVLLAKATPEPPHPPNPPQSPENFSLSRAAVARAHE